MKKLKLDASRFDDTVGSAKKHWGELRSAVNVLNVPKMPPESMPLKEVRELLNQMILDRVTIGTQISQINWDVDEFFKMVEGWKADIRDREIHNESQEKRLQKAQVDAQTGFLRDAAFTRGLRRFLGKEKNDSDGQVSALCLMDMRKLKKINDDPALGHLVANSVIAQTAALVRDNIPAELYARWGLKRSDEFLIYSHSLSGFGQIVQQLEAFLDAMKKHPWVHRRKVMIPPGEVGVDVGVVYWKTESASICRKDRREVMTDMIHHAERVMYAVKHGGAAWGGVNYKQGVIQDGGFHLIER